MTSTRNLLDEQGFRFGKSKSNEAQQGKSSGSTGLWPGLDRKVPGVERTMYTSVKDVICGSGCHE